MNRCVHPVRANPPTTQLHRMDDMHACCVGQHQPRCYLGTGVLIEFFIRMRGEAGTGGAIGLAAHPSGLPLTPRCVA